MIRMNELTCLYWCNLQKEAMKNAMISQTDKLSDKQSDTNSETDCISAKTFWELELTVASLCLHSRASVGGIGITDK